MLPSNTKPWSGHEDEAARHIYSYGILQEILCKVCAIDGKGWGFGHCQWHKNLIPCRNSFIDCEPRLILTTCLYLASKVEECTTQAKKFVLKMRELDSTFLYDMNHILECEFYVLEELEFSLVVFHPYRVLQPYLADHAFFAETNGDSNANIPTTSNMNSSVDKLNNAPLDKELVETAWSIINDSYRTDSCLLYPPHTIGLGCILVAMLLQGKEVCFVPHSLCSYACSAGFIAREIPFDSNLRV